MYYRFFPIYNRLRRVFVAQPSLDNTCIHKEVICPAEQSEVPGVDMDDHDRGLVTSTNFMTTLEREWQRVDGYMGQHQETVKYTFKNVLATPNGFCVFGASFSGSLNSYLGPIFTRKIPKIEKGFYASSWTAGTFFGHWLMDSVPMSLLRQNDEALYLWSPPSWKHANGYLKSLNIDRIKEDYVFFDIMSFCLDVGMNSNRRKRIMDVKERLTTSGKGIGSKKVYLSRGNSGISRVINNETELQDALKNYGFHILKVDDPYEKILETCQDAEITLSIEGSNFAHLMMCTGQGANHILINPSDRFSNIFADYIPALGDKLHNVVAIREGDGYRVDVPRLMSVIKKIES